MVKTLLRRPTQALTALALAAGMLVATGAQAQEPNPAPRLDSAARGASALTRPAPGGPALWRIADEDSELWLFGSVHMLRPGLSWRRPDLMAALESADAIYLEAATDLLSQLRAQAVVSRRGYLSDDETLLEHLRPATAARFEALVAEHGFDREAILRMRPWLAFTYLNYRAATAGGAEPTEGVDAQLEHAAAVAGIERRYFETLEQQTHLFADIPPDAQTAMLEAAVNEFDAASTQLDVLVAAWLEGDLDRLADLTREGATALPESFRVSLFDARNEAWARELDAFLDGSGDALVVVGAGHLVGPNNLLSLLEDRGWTVVRQ